MEAHSDDSMSAGSSGSCYTMPEKIETPLMVNFSKFVCM